MYRLSGQDFAKYVGQRVEIVGNVQPGGASSTASATSSGSSATASADRPAGGATAGATAGATESPRAGDRASTSDSSRPAADPAAGATRPQSPSAVGTSGAAAATMQNLTVTSVKEVAGNCR
jgi:hypothetical protein